MAECHIMYIQYIPILQFPQGAFPVRQERADSGEKQSNAGERAAPAFAIKMMKGIFMLQTKLC